ncbi:MAG: PilZ domain-containing protein [Treponema sp.]|nr:PilZ domain-containing protein [Treponema sp.]
MADADKSIYGRKVFFISPSIGFEQQVLERLRLMEYEVYAIDDYRKAKALLRKNADSICFCMADAQMTPKGWHNFISSFSEENVFSPLDMGVIMHFLPEDKQANFQAGLSLEAGILDLNEDAEEVFHKIVRAIDAKNAKGMRKYVRANCLKETQADLLWLKDNRMFKLKIIDISAVGIAARLSQGQANAVFINQIIEGVTLNLKSVQVSVDIQISAIKSAGDSLLVVIMFTASTTPDSINKIRAYIAENLKAALRSSIRLSDLDRTDYEHLE